MKEARLLVISWIILLAITALVAYAQTQLVDVRLELLSAPVCNDYCLVSIGNISDLGRTLSWALVLSLLGSLLIVVRLVLVDTSRLRRACYIVIYLAFILAGLLKPVS